MKKNHICFLFCLLTLSFLSINVLANPDVELLRKRFTAQMLESGVRADYVRQLLNTANEDGTWPGINYEDTSRIAFQHSTHLANMLHLSKAYKKPGSVFKGNKKVKKTLLAALDFWLANDFICENWWNNQIGTPNTMVAILLIMDKELSNTQVQKMLPIIGRAHLLASGARPSGDRIKIAGILAKYALFKRDTKLVEEVLQVIEGEIKFATGRGMQYDYSFHHREDRVNNTMSYGTGYADAFAEWAANVSDTRYRFSDKSITLLIDYYLDGICKQMVYGRTTDTGVMNRDIARPGEAQLFSAYTPERLLSSSDYRKAELEQIIKARKGEPFLASSYANFFWQAEHFVYQRPHYYTSVRMYSTRNANMEEPYNGEGLTNHFRGDGTNYISVKGDEYNNLTPVYDWRKIPGTTCMQQELMPSENEIQKYGLSSFVGGVTNNMFGAVVFDFKSPHNPLSAKKSWFFFNSEYVCLGAGIKSSTNNPVATTLNQCRLRGKVMVKSPEGVNTVLKGNRLLEDVSWIHHDSVGYIFPVKQKINLFNQTATGSWYQANRQTRISKEEVHEDVFKLWIDHGAYLANASYAYIVMPGTDLKTLSASASNLAVEIVSNTPEIQAVKHHAERLAYVVFYRSGVVKFSDKLIIGMDSPGMLMLRYDTNERIQELVVSDPSRNLGKIHLTVNQKITRQDSACTTTWQEGRGITEIAIELPQTVYAGKSVVVFSE